MLANDPRKFLRVINEKDDDNLTLKNVLIFVRSLLMMFSNVSFSQLQMFRYHLRTSATTL